MCSNCSLELTNPITIERTDFQVVTPMVCEVKIVIVVIDIREERLGIR